MKRKMKIKKLMILFLSVVMTLSLSTAVFATEDTGNSNQGTTNVPQAVDDNAVAKIGDKGFETLAEAVSFAQTSQESKTITLLQNIYLEETVKILADTNVTLDLNGKQITVLQTNGRSLYAIDNHGTLTVQDSSEGASGCITARGVENFGTMYMESGTIASCDSNGGGSAVWNEGKFEMTGGTLKFTGTKNGNSAGAPFTSATASATANITGGNLESPYTAIFVNAGNVTMKNITLSTVTDYWMAVKVAGGEAELNNVTINAQNGGCLENAGGTVTLKECTFTQDNVGNPAHNSSAVAVSNGGVVNVESGTYKAGGFGAYVYNSGGTININGGSFEAPTVLKADDSTVGSTINVYSGDFTGNYSIGNSSTLAIYGGIFSENPNDYCVDGYTAEELADGGYGTAVAYVTAEDGTETNYGDIRNAIAGLKANEKITLLADITNEDYSSVIDFKLPVGAVLDGNGKKIEGNVAVYVNAGGGTVKNVNFKNIHNEEDKLSAVYASGLTGKLTITDCEFDTCDWDAIQTTPQAGAVIDIENNTFRNTGDQGINTRRYVHVQSSYNTDFTVTVTKNKFYDGDKLLETALEVYYPTNIEKIKLDSNYAEDPMNSCILINNDNTQRPDLALPFMDKEMQNPVMPEAAIVVSKYNYFYYPKLADAISAVTENKATTITLLGDVSADDVITIPENKQITINLNGKEWNGNIVNNGTLSFSGTSESVSGKITNNGTLTMNVDAATKYAVENKGAVNITGGATYDLKNFTGNGSITITGGTFTTKPEDNLLAEWYIANALDDGTGRYKVAKMSVDQAKENGAVASGSQSGSPYYTSVSAAVEANNNSAYIQKDVDENISATRPDTKYYGKLYANGYHLTGSMDIVSNYADESKRYFELHADKDGTIELSSVRYNGDLRAYDGSVVLNSVEAPSIRVATYSTPAELTIKKGTVEGTVDVAASGMLNIEGGKYGGDLQIHVYYKKNETEPSYTSTLKITGGTFSSDEVKIVYTNHPDGTRDKTAPLSDYVPAGYKVIDNEDGTYTVKKEGTAEISVSQDGLVYSPNLDITQNISSSSNNTGVTPTYEYKKQDADDRTYTTEAPKTVGKYTVKVTFAATENYTEAVATADFEIAKADPEISVNAVENKKYGDDPFGLMVNKPEEVTVVTYESSDKKVATVDENGKVTIIGAGTATITVTISSSTNYNGGTETVTINVAKAAGIASVSMEGWTYGETAKLPKPASDTNGTENATYLYKVKDAEDSTYTSEVPTEAGTYTVKATFEATENYKAVEATANFTIAKADPGISVNTVEDKKYGDGAFDLTVNKPEEVTVVTYKSSDEKVATVDKTGRVTIVGAGEVKITVSTGESKNYQESSATVSFKVEKKNGTLTVTKTEYSVTYGADDFTIGVDAEDKNSDITYTSDNTAVATVDENGKVHIAGAGTATITVTLSGSANYNGDIKTVTINVAQADKPANTPEDISIAASDAAENLSDVTLPDGWSWKDGTTELIPGGKVEATAVYTGEDAGNYAKTEATVQISKMPEIVIDATDDVYVIGTDTEAVVKCTGALSELKNVEVDGTVVDASNYELESGSTILTFNKEYMDTLTVGEHTVTMNYTVGSADTIILVKKPDTEEQPGNGQINGDQNGGTTDVKENSASQAAQTGEDSHITWYFILMLAAAMGIVAVVISRKKNLYRK